MTQEHIPGSEQPTGAGSSVWRIEKASRASVIVDADGYFALIREAMMRARRQVFLIGWDFDTRIKLDPRRRVRRMQSGGEEHPARLGPFITWLARRTPRLEIRLLQWRFALVKSLLRGRMIFDLLGWVLRRRIDFKFDAAHPVGGSQHQKIVVIDDRLAVCGGIDMTSDRWDTRDHLDGDIRRAMRRGGFYGPWHDLTMMMEGEVAGALADLGRERWATAGGASLPPCDPVPETAWPARLSPDFEHVEIGIARTRAAYGDDSQVAEIEALFLEHIARARRFFYAETQYFASRRIAEAIAARLDEPDPPEFVIINPRHASGWLEQQVMDTARVRLVRSLMERDHADRFRIYAPYTSAGTPIYVHAKLTIVDDEVIRVGSANMNNRSMGLDSECDVFIDAARPANRGIEPRIRRIRHSLLAEHTGLPVEELADRLAMHGSMIVLLDGLSQVDKHLARLPIDKLNAVQAGLADSAVLDPERPEELFEPLARRGLFRHGGLLRHPGNVLANLRQ